MNHLPSAAFLSLLALGLGSGCAQAQADEENRSGTGGESDIAPGKAAPILARVAAPARSCPKEMAEVGQACVDRWEAHLVSVNDQGEASVHPSFERPRASLEYQARSASGVKPQGYISRTESALACENAGKRLCSVTEWYGACSGSRKTTYPYGAKFQKGACNVNRPHLLSRWFGDNPRSWKYVEHFNNPKLNQLEGWLANTGAFQECQSDYGVHDMVGNLHEWIDGDAGRAITRALPMKPGVRQALSPQRSGRGVFMGGFYSTLNQHGEGCSFVTMAHEPNYHDYSTGFRCCKDL